jgi:hypothetical protein
MNVQTKTAEPTVINGINVDDLFGLIQSVKQDAAKGQTNWRVTTTWQADAELYTSRGLQDRRREGTTAVLDRHR